LTSLINARKPTPFDEARNIIYFLRHVYYEAVGELYATIKKIVRNSCFDCPAIIQLGFWPGGDRDGNPFVTSAITNDVADELRMNLMKCYYRDVKRLARKLTFRRWKVLENLRATLYVTMFDPTKTMRYEEILDPLVDIRASLIENYNSLYLDELDTLIDKVNIFKTHFAALDIRQNHGVHRQTVEAILKQENLVDRNRLDELGKAELLTILLHEDILCSPISLTMRWSKTRSKPLPRWRTSSVKTGPTGATDMSSVTPRIFFRCCLYSACYDGAGGVKAPYL
jgi:phosphoenolpyruvate carboxylase